MATDQDSADVGLRRNAAVAQRLDDLSRVAGRLAHDFDNVLTGVIGFAELAMPLVPANAARQHLDELHRCAIQGIGLTRRLHLLSRAGVVRPERLAPSTLLEALVQRVRAGSPAGVAIDLNLPTAVPSVSGDAEMLSLALEQLAVNAVEACGDVGVVKIGVAAQTVAGPDARTFFGDVTPGTHVVIEISDSGHGITPDVKDRLFVEPFFSTRPHHRGLGLTLVFRILYAHHAGVMLQSVPNGGTLARVVIPAAVAMDLTRGSANA